MRKKQQAKMYANLERHCSLATIIGDDYKK